MRQRGRGKSAFRGVAQKADSKKWRAQIQLHLGNYDSEQEAADIYADAEKLFRTQALELRRRRGALQEG